MQTHKQTAVYVYEAPVRVWHWVNALSITLLAITGYLIANPLPTLSGEAFPHFSTSPSNHCLPPASRPCVCIAQSSLPTTELSFFLVPRM